MRIHLTFPEELIKEPVIYNLGKDYNIVTNIRRANVEKKVGWVILEIEGAPEDLQRGLAYLESTEIQVDTMDGDLLES